MFFSCIVVFCILIRFVILFAYNLCLMYVLLFLLRLRGLRSRLVNSCLIACVFLFLLLLVGVLNTFDFVFSCGYWFVVGFCF